jgi:serine/threonine protein kinase
MRRLDHPNCLKLHAIYENADSLCLVLDYLADNDLFSLIIKHERFTEKQAATVVQGILSGLAYLHSNEIVHRDVKLENVLVRSAEKFEVLLGDFGLAA